MCDSERDSWSDVDVKPKNVFIKAFVLTKSDTNFTMLLINTKYLEGNDRLAEKNHFCKMKIRFSI